ncbi:MAG: YdcF family protein [Oscillospiraceae bacterium]
MEKKRVFSPVALVWLAASAGMCLWFVLPGFFNAGTFLGVTLCVLAAGCVLFRFMLAGLIRHLWRRIPGRAALCALAAVIAGFVGYCGINLVKMAQYTDKPLDEVKCVMILGCQVHGTEPGNEMINRLSTALPLIEANPGVPVVVTGGQGRGEDITEADCMKQWLLAQGVEKERIYTECSSHSTATNFANSAPILQELGISDGIAVVTNDFHQYRADIYARRLGLSVGHYSAATRLLVLPNYLIRELAALFFV